MVDDGRRDMSAMDLETMRDEIAGLTEALRGRTLTSQATGLMAGRFGLSTTQAWRLLVRTSNHTNIRLRELSRILVAAHDGTLGEADRADAGLIAEILPVVMAHPFNA